MKELLQKAIAELVQTDRVIAFVSGLVIAVTAALLHMPEGKVHDLVCGVPAVTAPAK